MFSICILAQFPPPIHGLSKAVDTLFHSRLKNKYHFSKINITNNWQILQTCLSILKSQSDIVYFTPSQTRGGNIRDLVFLKLIEWRKKKCIAHIHGGYFRQLIEKDCPLWQRTLNYKAIRKLAGGIVLGNSLHHIFEGLLPNEKIFVCPNCVDDAFIAPSIDNKISDIKIKKEPLHILYLSNFIESKGYREVLKLARIAKERGDREKFTFHFAGKFFDSQEELFFTENCKDLENVEYHGIVGGKNKVALLQKCHIFTLLSKYSNEGQPISILEAMGNGMSIVTTDHAGIPEVANSENGFVSSKHDIQLEPIYDYLITCYNNREKLAETCLKNHQITQEKYTEKQYINNMDKIFETI